MPLNGNKSFFRLHTHENKSLHKPPHVNTLPFIYIYWRTRGEKKEKKYSVPFTSARNIITQCCFHTSTAASSISFHNTTNKFNFFISN